MFCINLVSAPYYACIIAYERMAAFAYISILEASLRLLICFLIVVSPFDKLISYAILLVIVALIIRFVYGVYCNRHFEECHYRFVYDRSLLKQMGSFAGWQFLPNGCWLFNTQGVNILINILFWRDAERSSRSCHTSRRSNTAVCQQFHDSCKPADNKRLCCGEDKRDVYPRLPWC